jgi:hypothetical protein
MISLALRGLMLGVSAIALGRDRTQLPREQMKPQPGKPPRIAGSDTPSDIDGIVDKFSPNDPEAVKAGFTLDVANVDRNLYPEPKPGVSCGTCVAYHAKDSQWGACTVHRKLVPFKGWCGTHKLAT